MSQITRAYSLLHVKSVDAERRIITGIATTPEPDRVDDVVEPLGVKFKNPLPLLLFHDAQRPVGTVKFDKPTADGITFEAHLPDIAEPGALKDRITEAWQSIKAGLVKGVSIGFRALPDGIELLRTGGLRFLKTEVLELSLVTVPANASATIQMIKSLDVGLAATGTEPPIVPKAAGVSAPVVHLARRGASTMKTLAEQITAFEATRQAKAAQLDAVQTKASEEGRTKDASERETFDTLKAEIAGIDAELKDLRDMEAMQAKAAKPAAGYTPEEGTQSRGTGVIQVKENLPPGIEFARLVICKAASFISMMNGEGLSALQIAKERYPSNQRIQEVLKATVAAGTTADATFAGPLTYAATLATEFVEYLRPQTILGKFGANGVPSLRRVPFNVRIVGQTSGGTGYWVGQGKPKPLTKFDFEANSLGWAKVAAISVISEESARFSSPSSEALVRDGLAGALVARMDTDFVDPAKAVSANVSPASITNGLSPLSPSGTDADAIRTDLGTLLGHFINANVNPSSLVLIMPNTVAMVIGLLRNGLGQREFPDINMNGGTIEGIPVITSQYAAKTGGPGNMVIAVNASDIYFSDDGAVQVDVSREASLEMSDGPGQDGAAGTGASLVSLWQNNLLGLRAERFVNWSKRRTSAVVYMDDVAWGGAGSPS